MRLPHGRSRPVLGRPRRDAAGPPVGRPSVARGGLAAPGRPVARPAVRRGFTAVVAPIRAPQPPEPPPRGHGLTSRVAVLAVAVCAVVLTVAYPLRSYLAQRAEISGLRAAVASQRAQVVELSRAIARWSDPNYVRIQAREQLDYAMPGERQYILLMPPRPGRSAAGGAPVTGGGAGAWYTRLWSSEVQAGR